MRREVNDEDGVGSGSDRISQLPESVLLRILCFVSLKKAVQTRVLSKSWRHLGPTRPVIDLRGVCDGGHARRTKFCENCFCGNNEAFISAADNTFKRYRDQNLPLRELRLEMSKDDSVVFKDNVYLHRCKISSLIENVVLKNLKRLTLSHVYIDDEALQKIMSGCPLVEYVELSYCKGLKTICVANENHRVYLKDFKFFGSNVKKIELNVIEIDGPALQSLRIQICSNWKLNPNNYFPHLKYLHLFYVQLSTESFENFSCNFPLLEKFKLLYCSGFEEIKLYCPSLKHLTMRLNRSIKVDIDAPNILCFKFSGYCPKTISFTTTSMDWKSKITLDDHDDVFYADALPWFLEINKMVKALSTSEISLDISEIMFYESMQIECGIHDPVVVLENLEIQDTRLNLIPSLFYALFQICRPRHVITRYGLECSNHDEGWVGYQIDELEDILLHEREYKEYYWQQHLEEVSIEAFDFGEGVWQRVQGKCLPESASKEKVIRFGLKWRE